MNCIPSNSEKFFEERFGKFLTDSGMLPEYDDRLVLSKSVRSLESCPIPRGMLPVKSFRYNCNDVRLDKFSNPEGIFPVSAILPVYSASTFV